jgi:hypothetical protein
MRVVELRARANRLRSDRLRNDRGRRSMQRVLHQRARAESPGGCVSDVGVNPRGSWQWLSGDREGPNYVTKAYGTVYRAVG